MEKVKIILDADVLIHFSKAGKLSLLPTILPEYDHAILSAVYEETISIRTQIDNQMKFLKNMVLLPFEPTGQRHHYRFSYPVHVITLIICYLRTIGLVCLMRLSKAQ